MANNFDVVSFANAILVKHELVTASVEQLQSLNENPIEYSKFINSVIDILNEEEVYFYLNPSIMDKVLDVLNHNRFSDDNEQIRGAISNIIMVINRMKTVDEPYKMMLMENYKAFNEQARKVTIDTYDDLLYVVSSDAIAFENLIGGLDEIDNKSVFVASLNYFVSCAPEIFLNDSIRSRANSILKKLSKSAFPLDFQAKKYIKTITTSINNIGKKEE